MIWSTVVAQILLRFWKPIAAAAAALAAYWRGRHDANRDATLEQLQAAHAVDQEQRDGGAPAARRRLRDAAAAKQQMRRLGQGGANTRGDRRHER